MWSAFFLKFELILSYFLKTQDDGLPGCLTHFQALAAGRVFKGADSELCDQFQ